MSKEKNRMIKSVKVITIMMIIFILIICIISTSISGEEWLRGMDRPPQGWNSPPPDEEDIVYYEVIMSRDQYWTFIEYGQLSGAYGVYGNAEGVQGTPGNMYKVPVWSREHPEYRDADEKYYLDDYSFDSIESIRIEQGTNVDEFIDTLEYEQYVGDVQYGPPDINFEDFANDFNGAAAGQDYDYIFQLNNDGTMDIILRSEGQNYEQRVATLNADYELELGEFLDGYEELILNNIKDGLDSTGFDVSDFDTDEVAAEIRGRDGGGNGKIIKKNDDNSDNGGKGSLPEIEEAEIVDALKSDNTYTRPDDSLEHIGSGEDLAAFYFVDPVTQKPVYIDDEGTLYFAGENGKPPTKIYERKNTEIYAFADRIMETNIKYHENKITSIHTLRDITTLSESINKNEQIKTEAEILGIMGEIDDNSVDNINYDAKSGTYTITISEGTYVFRTDGTLVSIQEPSDNEPINRGDKGFAERIERNLNRMLGLNDAGTGPRSDGIEGQITFPKNDKEREESRRGSGTEQYSAMVRFGTGDNAKTVYVDRQGNFYTWNSEGEAVPLESGILYELARQQRDAEQSKEYDKNGEKLWGDAKKDSRRAIGKYYQDRASSTLQMNFLSRFYTVADNIFGDYSFGVPQGFCSAIQYTNPGNAKYFPGSGVSGILGNKYAGTHFGSQEDYFNSYINYAYEDITLKKIQGERYEIIPGFKYRYHYRLWMSFERPGIKWYTFLYNCGTQDKLFVWQGSSTEALQYDFQHFAGNIQNGAKSLANIECRTDDDKCVFNAACIAYQHEVEEDEDDEFKHCFLLNGEFSAEPGVGSCHSNE